MTIHNSLLKKTNTKHQTSAQSFCCHLNSKSKKRGLQFPFKKQKNFADFFLLMSDPMKRTNFHLQNALLSAIPFLANWLFSIFYSRVLDFLVGKKIIKTVHARKTSMAIGKLVIEFKSVSFLTNQSLKNIALPPNSADTLLYVSKTYNIELKGL